MTPAKELERARRALVREIHDELAERYQAPIVIGGRALTGALSYPSQAAFRQAHARGALPVSVFAMPQRRGYWAMTREVAEHLAAQRFQASTQTTPQRRKPAAPRKKRS